MLTERRGASIMFGFNFQSKMITFIQNILQKHHKFVFSILLVVIIIAFVFTIGNSLPDFALGNASFDNRKDFYGYDLSDSDQLTELQTYVYFETRLANQRVNPNQAEMLILRQAIVLYLAKEWNLRQVNEAELREYVMNLPAFAGKDGKFDAKLWENFVKVQTQNGMPEAYLNKILSVNALTRKVLDLLGGPGYALTQDVERQYKRTAGTWDVEIAVMPLDQFSPEIKSDDKALETYFKSNIENYRLAAATTMSIAKFPADVSGKKPTEVQLQAFYNQNMQKYTKVGTDGKPALKTFAEAKADVEKDWALAEALNEAHRAADDIVTKIYDSSAKFGSDTAANILKSKNIKLQKLPPVRATDVDLPKDIPHNVIAAGMGLDENSFYSDAIVAEDGAYIVFFDKRDPSRLPEFSEVKGKVKQDYEMSEKIRLFNERGKKLSETLKASVKGGKGFAPAAAAEGVKVSSAKNFSIIKPDTKLDDFMKAYYLLGSELPKMRAGDVSDMHTLYGTGYIIYVSANKEPEIKSDSTEFKNITGNAANYYSAIAAQSVIADMTAAKRDVLEDEKPQQQK